MKKDWQLLKEEPEFLIVNKASGLLTIPDRFNPGKPNLVSQLRTAYGDVRVVHRIDRETSGILIFARTEEAHRALSLQFEQRTIQKYYWVLLEGRLPNPSGILEAPIAPHPSKGGRMILSDKGKPARTDFLVTQYFRGFTLIEARIHTGRQHQIRVHFQGFGFPLAVDSLYGHQDALYLSQIKGRRYRPNRTGEERPLLNRLSLHALRLRFDHPTTGERIEAEAELPKDLSASLKQLQKWAAIDKM